MVIWLVPRLIPGCYQDYLLVGTKLITWLVPRLLPGWLVVSWLLGCCWEVSLAGPKMVPRLIGPWLTVGGPAGPSELVHALQTVSIACISKNFHLVSCKVWRCSCLYVRSHFLPKLRVPKCSTDIIVTNRNAAFPVLMLHDGMQGEDGSSVTSDNGWKTQKSINKLLNYSKVMINERIRPDNDNEWLNELLY